METMKIKIIRMHANEGSVPFFHLQQRVRTRANYPYHTRNLFIRGDQLNAMNVDDAQCYLDNHKDYRICYAYSNDVEDILFDHQHRTIERGDCDKEYYEKKLKFHNCGTSRAIYRNVYLGCPDEKDQINNTDFSRVYKKPKPKPKRKPSTKQAAKAMEKEVNELFFMPYKARIQAQDHEDICGDR